MPATGGNGYSFLIDNAISLDADTAYTSDRGRPSERDSGLSGVTTKVSGGAPSHAAPYTIVLPSGPNRARRIVPRRNVSRW